MKSGFLAVMALLGHVSAVQLRKESMYHPEFYAGLYTNILLDVDSYKHHHDKKSEGKLRKDAYDLDPTTVSPYDAMDQHQPWTNEQRKEWFENKAKHDKNTYKIFDAQIDSESLAQKPKRDAYDHMPTLQAHTTPEPTSMAVMFTASRTPIPIMMFQLDQRRRTSSLLSRKVTGGTRSLIRSSLAQQVLVKLMPVRDSAVPFHMERTVRSTAKPLALLARTTSRK